MATAAGSLTQYPHSLAYFNLAAGGPAQGHRHLLSSALDWGQDLFELRRWIDAHPEAAGMKIAYFGIMHPGHVGLRNPIPPLLRRPANSRELSKRVVRAAEAGSGADAQEEREHNAAAAAAGVERGAWAEPGWYAVSVSFVMGDNSPVMDGTSRLHLMEEGDLSYS